MAKRTIKQKLDYVERGSDRHAMVLGLVKDPGSEFGWKLADPTAYGPTATEVYLREVLRQKVSDLNTAMPTIQSEDPLSPGFAPPMWRPVGEEDEATGIV